MSSAHVAPDPQLHSGGSIDMDPASHPVPDSANGRLTPIPATSKAMYANGNGNGNGSASGVMNVVRKKLGGYVGFANLPDQVHQKSIR